MKKEKCKCCKMDLPDKNGKATRAVDRIIQELFEEGRTVFREDPSNCNEDGSIKRTLKDKVMKRLALEHPDIQYQTITTSFTNLEGIQLILKTE